LSRILGRVRDGQKASSWGNGCGRVHTGPRRSHHGASTPGVPVGLPACHECGPGPGDSSRFSPRLRPDRGGGVFPPVPRAVDTLASGAMMGSRTRRRRIFGVSLTGPAAAILRQWGGRGPSGDGPQGSFSHGAPNANRSTRGSNRRTSIRRADLNGPRHRDPSDGPDRVPPPRSVPSLSPPLDVASGGAPLMKARPPSVF
jgi:hypothetical protein